ncbi:hypothetical protein F5B22DRAFT_659693 [Xylaria bambusicola]|uniref:uncharacterized protein n=1 Tax=Xylaria bambusicola TaxID=326684 RepID=UPI0020085B9F|nr:uncharacterized protein F5B22DRAFT_659693 [Xylaria bambusicola]KAI0523932.1 hypothetical protein F5B22DRAFT_659693 [Xylaria bambusicola]
MPPSTMMASTPYTSSYLAIRGVSPPSSPLTGPLQNSLSSQQTHEPLDPRITSPVDPSRSTRKRKRTITSSALNKLSFHSKGIVGLHMIGESRNIPSVPKKAPASHSVNIQHTMKLINVLIKNKSLFYRCMAESQNEEDQNCKDMMRRISAVVKGDKRFQSWQQVKSWVRRQWRKGQQGKKSRLSTPSSSVGMRRGNATSSIKNSFERNLVPILRAAEMNKNAGRFLSSVTEAIGSKKLIQIFRHHLARDELPEDIAPLIFSPLYLKLCERQIQKVARARSMTAYPYDSDSDGWYESETSCDVLAENEYRNNGDNVEAASASFHVLPSIENDDDDGVMDNNLSEMTVSVEKTIEPSTQTETRQPVIRKQQARTSNQARTGTRDSNSGTDNKRRSESQHPTPSGSQGTAGKSRFQHVIRQDEVHVGRKESSRTLDKKKAGLVIGPAPYVRPFSDLMLSTAFMTPAPEEECLDQVEALLLDTDERGADGNTNADSAGEETLDLPNSNTSTTTQPVSKKKRQKRKSKQRKSAKREKEHSDKTATNEDTIAKGTYPHHNIGKAPSPSLSRGRRTPKILADENRKQARKLAKPLAAKSVPSRAAPPPIRKATFPVYKVLQRRVVHKEIQPPMFYKRLRSRTAPRAISRQRQQQQQQRHKSIGSMEGRSRLGERSISDDGRKGEPTLPGLDLLRTCLLAAPGDRRK